MHTYLYFLTIVLQLLSFFRMLEEAHLDKIYNGFD